jgi:hypothetical protein
MASYDTSCSSLETKDKKLWVFCTLEEAEAFKEDECDCAYDPETSVIAYLEGGFLKFLDCCVV